MEKKVITKKVEEIFSVRLFESSSPIDIPNTIRGFSKNKFNNGYFSISKVYNTVPKKQFIEHYGNPLAEVYSRRMTLVVEETDIKTSFKFYFNFKRRRVGSKYFSRSRNIFFITFNKKTHNIYSGSLIGKHRLHKKIRVNNPNHIRNTIYGILATLPVHELTEFNTEFILNIFNTWAIRIGMEPYQFPSSNDSLTKDLIFWIQKQFYKIKGIKVPNNYKVFIMDYPGSKFLKKTDGKLVEAFMKKNNLKGSKMKKYLHEATSVEYLRNLLSLYGLVGIDLFNKIPEQNIRMICHSCVNSHITDVKEKDRIKFFNLLNDGLHNPHFSKWTLMHVSEHLRFRKFLEEECNNQFDFKFKDYTSFHYEHVQLSELAQSYKKGLYERIYSKEFIEKIQEPIYDFNGVEYHPVVLQTTNHYNEESQVQQNCVRTYCEYPDRLIVSLREVSPEGINRATIEYKYNSKFYFGRRQTLGRFNKQLDNKWYVPIEILDYKIKTHSELFDFPKLKITKPNGFEKIKVSQDHEGSVIWKLDVENKFFF